jgi:CubicO group peptidase (beta-lactamase class C family)
VAALMVSALIVGSLGSRGFAASAPTAEQLDQLVNSTAAKPNGPGLSVAVYRNGALVYVKAIGLSDLDHQVPITSRTVFDIASMSKQFTAMAIVLLQEDGKLSLDDRITKYLPELAPVANQVTIRQLLNHTSGIRDYLDMMGLAGDDPQDRVVSQADVLVVAARERALNFAPGSRFNYDNTSYALMATVVERVARKPLAQFADERIFRPLGMNSTHFYPDHVAVIPNRAFGYEPAGESWNFLAPFSDEIGDGGVWTSVEDLAKWDANFYRPIVGGKLALSFLQTPGHLNDGQQLPYALGLFVQETIMDFEWFLMAEWIQDTVPRCCAFLTSS